MTDNNHLPANAHLKNHHSALLKVAVFVSGSGTNLQALIDSVDNGELPIQIVGVISNREDAYAIERAKKAGLPIEVLSHTTSGKRMALKTFERHALSKLQEWQVDLVVLAGFMRVLSADFIASMPIPIINLHPSLLPYYKGLNTHERVLKSGDRWHGCSVHLVTAELDSGKVLTQAVLATQQNETAEQLKQRVQVLEHQLLPWTILLIAKGVLANELNLNPKEENQLSSLPKLPLKLCYA